MDEMEEEKEKKEEELAKQRREAKVSLAGLKVAHDIRRSEREIPF